ncbi:MAG: LON peptidase substrate-binding domain-containing protein [Chitinophagales bacterium]
MQSKQTQIPIFPLSLVVFPGESLNLHIFEKRYKLLVNECLSSGIDFGIPCYIDGKIGNYGTCVKIDQIDRVYTNGEMDIKTIGTQSFKINEIFSPNDKDKYAKANVEWREIIQNGSDVLKRKIYELTQTLHKFLGIEADQLEPIEKFDLHKVIHIVGLKLQQEYKFLQMKDELSRQEFLLRHLKGILPIVEETEHIKRKIQSNGHFKNIIPPNF